MTGGGEQNFLSPLRKQQLGSLVEKGQKSVEVISQQTVKVSICFSTAHWRLHKFFTSTLDGISGKLEAVPALTPLI